MNPSEKSLLHNKPDYLVCTCMGVMYSDILNALESGHQDFKSLSESLMVGTGCNSCVEEVLFLIQEYLAAKK